MGRKLTKEELEKKKIYHTKKVVFYEKKIELADKQVNRIGFKWYD